MDSPLLYLILGLAYAAFSYYTNLKKKQAEAEKKHPPPPSRSEPEDENQDQPFQSLEDIIRRAAEESRKQREEARRKRELEQQRKVQQQPTRTWVNEKPKPVQRKSAQPFLNEDNRGYRDPQMEAITTLEGMSLETIGEEGGISISDVHKPIETVTIEEQAPTINLRQAMLHQVILQRPEY